MNDERTEQAAEGSERADPVQAGLEQFQRAALEAIRAGRAMLDAAEAIVQDPNAADTVVRTVGGVARMATEAVAGFAAGGHRCDDAGGRSTDRSEGEDPPDDGFERISVG